MNNNFKIVLKIIIVIVILLNLPFQKVFSENIENVAASLSATDVQKQQNGKSIQNVTFHAAHIADKRRKHRKNRKKCHTHPIQDNEH